jgi:isocitrate/isopropylmalate dehydrogenase
MLLIILKKLNLHANIRPANPFPRVIGITGRSDFDFIFVGKNTEELYSGIERRDLIYSGQKVLSPEEALRGMKNMATNLQEIK